MNRHGAARQRPGRLARRLRFRAWHAVRHHYMAGFSAVLLLLAGAASLGSFSKPDPELDLDRRVIAVAPRPIAPAVSINIQRTPRLVMTYYMVDSQEMVDSFNMIKTELRHKEWLEKSAFEVLLVRTPDEQVQAQKAIDDARERCVCAEFHVVDLRK
jgi:hypothetical protein